MVERGDGEEAVAAAVSLTESWIGKIVVVSVTGVLDMLTAPQLLAAVRGTLNRGPSAIVIDLCDLGLLASVGISALIAARDEAAPSRFAVAADGPGTSRVMRLLGLDDILNLRPTVAAALASAGDV